jgi:hypothetical protein
MVPSEAKERTYGNWRKPTSPGIGQLGMFGTLLLLVGLVLVVIMMLASLYAGVVTAVVVAVALAPLLIRDRHGRNALQSMTARFAWWRGRTKGWHIYRSGPLGIQERGTCRLPGLLAASRLVEAEDSYGRRFGMVILPATGHYSVVFESGADGAALVDSDQVDTWVAHWGQWLASLGFEPGLAAASVTIETAPDLGHRLRSEVSANVSAQGPELARQVLAEIVRTYPVGSAQVSTRVAVTYSAAPRPGAKRRTTGEMAREIGMRLPGLTHGLAMTGAGSSHPMTASQLAEAIRVAYDPDSQAALEGMGPDDPEVTWDEAGPTAHQESWDHYVHDSGASITWGMTEAPRGLVMSNVLTGLVAPHPDIARKRVTLVYRPHDAAAAARIVERDRKDARFRLTGPNVAARDAVAVAAADQSAREEARGAGVVRFTVLVTATVRRIEDLRTAAATVDVLAPPARLRLRRVYGSQAAAFAASLPLGIVLPEHLQVPGTIREIM